MRLRLSSPSLAGRLLIASALLAALLGAVFVVLAWRLRAAATPRGAALLFHYSLAYLAVLFVAMAVDPLVL